LRALILLLLMIFVNALNATSAEEYCQIHHQVLSSALHECSFILQDRWFVDSPLQLTPIELENLLISIQQENQQQHLGLATRPLFDLLWRHERKFIGSLTPNILVISLDNDQIPLEKDVFLRYWLKNTEQEPLRFLFPLWDLTEQGLTDIKELRGKMSFNNLELLKKYHAPIVLIIHGDIENDNIQARIFDLYTNNEAFSPARTLKELLHFLRLFMIKHYALPNSLETIQITASRSFWTYQSLEQMLLSMIEVESINPKEITREHIVIDVKSHWRTRHWAIFRHIHPYLSIVDHD